MPYQPRLKWQSNTVNIRKDPLRNHEVFPAQWILFFFQILWADAKQKSGSFRHHYAPNKVTYSSNFCSPRNNDCVWYRRRQSDEWGNVDWSARSLWFNTIFGWWKIALEIKGLSPSAKEEEWFRLLPPRSLQPCHNTCWVPPEPGFLFSLRSMNIRQQNTTCFPRSFSLHTAPCCANLSPIHWNIRRQLRHLFLGAHCMCLANTAQPNPVLCPSPPSLRLTLQPCWSAVHAWSPKQSPTLARLPGCLSNKNWLSSFQNISLVDLPAGLRRNNLLNYLFHSSICLHSNAPKRENKG